MHTCFKDVDTFQAVCMHRCSRGMQRSLDILYVCIREKIFAKRDHLIYSYFMDVWRIGKLLALGAVDDRMHCCPRPIVYSYFMPVCGIVKTTARGAVDSSMHYCPRPPAIVHRAVHCAEGSSFDYSTKTAEKKCFITRLIPKHY